MPAASASHPLRLPLEAAKAVAALHQELFELKEELGALVRLRQSLDRQGDPVLLELPGYFLLPT